jgi:1-deoxyxylulose-5-phosphate synthase
LRSQRFAPLDRDLSRLALGTAWWTHEELGLARELTDAWLELGGNLFDTARAYGEGERVLASCLADRRDDVVILTKAAHHDRSSEGGPLLRRATPEDIAADLETSLAKLRTDRVEILMLHRDDRSLPVGPIVEALNAHRRSGRILSFGASNWAPARLDEAAAYAREHGLEPFTSSSVQLSLAVWTEAPWPECEDGHDAEIRRWYERAELPLFAWSAQAAGFFAGSARPKVAAVFETAENRARLARAEELGSRLGATATQVALAWVLQQPFSTYAVVGPRSVSELRACVDALELTLSEDELRWLDEGPG